ncbi:type II secretion system protein J [Chloroflexota bacterium]
MRKKRQAGYTLIEMVVVMTLLGLTIAPMAAIIYQLVWIPAERSDTLTVLQDLRQAVRWITEDTRQATTFNPGTEPDYGTFSWTDRSSGSAVSYTVRYYYSSSDKRLMREETIDGSPKTVLVSDNVDEYNDISFEETDGLLSASVTATIDSSWDTITRTGSLKAQMRPEASASDPTPPPITLAWDDFESGGWTGGTNWVDDWYYLQDTDIVTSGSPYEGTYHLELVGSDGYADRAIDLSGQSNIRLQFWAKVDSFKSGDTAVCQVSSDGVVWHTVRTWVDGEDDNIYRYEDIDLSSYTMSSEFWIAFDAQMSLSNDYFWVDDLKVVKTY